MPFMPNYEFMPNINTLCIKACMGLGKTNTLYEFINRKTYHSVLIISFRVTLEKKYMEDLPDFELYSDFKGKITSEEHPYTIIQIDSLHRVKSHYDLIILDEITYGFSHLITSCKRREPVYECLTQLLHDNNRIIAMDAFLDDNIVNWLSSFENRKINFIENIYSIHTDKSIVSYKHDINNFVKEIEISLKKKEKIVIASNNKKELKNIENIINNKFKKCKKLFITKESENKDDISLWKDMDVVAYTPTITAGISFIEKHFDKCFGLFINSSSPADMAVQQLFRVRNISSGEYHICCKIKGKKDYPINDNDIDDYIIKGETCLVSGVDGIKLDYINDTIKKDRYYYLYKIIQKKIFKSNNNFMEYMIELLKEQGIKRISYNCTYNKEETKKYNKEYREYTKYMNEIEAEEICSKEPITEEYAEELREKYNKTNDEILTLKRHNFVNLSKISNELLNKDIYIKFSKYNKILYNIGYVYAFKDNLLENLNKRINYIENNTKNSTINRLHKNKKFEKIVYANDILIKIGFNTLFTNEEIEINKEIIKKYILEHGENLEILFRTNKHNWKDIIEKDDKYFNKIMRYLNDRLNSIYKIRVILNKKSNKYYIKGLDFWDDNSITYKNKDLINEIRNTEKELYEQENFEKELMELLNAPLENENINNSKCIKCGSDTIFGNEYCVKHKFEKLNFIY